MKVKTEMLLLRFLRSPLFLWRLKGVENANLHQNHEKSFFNINVEIEIYDKVRRRGKTNRTTACSLTDALIIAEFFFTSKQTFFL